MTPEPPHGSQEPWDEISGPQKPPLVCVICGAELDEASLGAVCDECRASLAGGKVEQDQEKLEIPGKTALPVSGRRSFAHFKLELGPDGEPIELGRGAMAVTYKALDVALKRPVALKVIDSRLIKNASLKTRFIREARAAAVLRHPNIASVYYLGSIGNSYFYAMELVAGNTVEKILATEGPLKVHLALEITEQVASALDAAHQAGLVHRDIKPANLIACFDERGHPTVKVIDFGLVQPTAEMTEGEGDFDREMFLGTPVYASPEQFKEGRVDIRSDLYSLGVTLWQMLTKTMPFTGSPAQIASQHLGSPLPLFELRHLPQPAVFLLTYLLEKNPVDRPQTPRELLAILRATIRALGGRQPLLSKQPNIESSEPATSGEGGSLRKPFGPGPLPEPWDFTPFLVAKTKDFTGREWLFQELEEWRAHSTAPALLIVGEPGLGKSAIVASLIRRNSGGRVLAYHCCRVDTPATLEPAGFVRNVAGMFSLRLADYASALSSSSVINFLRRSDVDPISAFEAAVLAPLHKIQPPADGRYYLVVDSLDEALTRASRPTIIDVLSNRLDRLPSWLCLVATTRKDPGVLNQLGGLRAHILAAEDPRNQRDVRRFIRYRLAEPGLRGRVRASGKPLKRVQDDLLRSSSGNFLFVTTALDAIESGRLSFDQVEHLPPGLSSLYEIFFHRLFRDAGVDFESSRSVLETVAAARESLSRDQIASAAGLDAEDQLPSILSRLASFVPAVESRYALFHKSLADWLTGWDLEQDQPFAGTYHVSLQNGSVRLANWCWAEYQHGLANISLYCLRHFPTHLHQAGRAPDLGRVLRDFHFLRTKLEATDESALITDYSYLPKKEALALVQSAIRLSAHVLARDHRQLGSQLIGRLLGHPSTEIQFLLSEAAQNNAFPWVRPLTASLSPPGGPLIRTWEGHTNWVHAVALLPGEVGVISAGDWTLRVWDLESNRSTRVFAGHTGSVRDVKIMPDGNRVISVSSDRTLRFWDLANGKLINILEGHRDGVLAVAVSPDGRRAVSASADQTLLIWDTDSGLPLRRLEGHADAVNGVALTFDGRRAISASSDGTLRVWELDSGRFEHALEGHTGVVNSVALTPDGKRAISASSDHTLRVWDLERGRSLHVLEGHTSGVSAVAVTAEGNVAVSCSWDHTLRVWNLDNGQLMHILKGHTDSVTTVALTPDGTRAVSGSPDHSLRVWDLKKGLSLRVLEGHTDWVTAVIVTADGRRAISCSADHTLRMWDLEQPQSGHRFTGYSDGITAVALLPDGGRVALASEYHLLHVWDLESGEMTGTLSGHTDWITAATVTPDGRLAITASADRTVRVWRTESGQPISTLIGHTGLVSAVAITPDGQLAISASVDHSLRLWKLDTSQVMQTLASHSDLVTAIALTPDGRCAVWGSDAGALLVWKLADREVVRTLTGHRDWVTAVAVTPDGRLVVSASASKTLRVTDLATGQLVQTLEGHTDLVTAVALTPDGQRAISASADHTLRVWELESGHFLMAFTGEGPMWRFAIASDGRTVVAREKSGRGHILSLEGL